MYLLDTDVLSLTSPLSRLEGEGVENWRNWVAANSASLHFSTITLLEIRFGIEKLLSRGAAQRAEKLQRWIAIIQGVHQSRLMPVSGEIADRAGVLLFKAHSDGHSPSSEDAIVAATAELLKFRLLSRNVKHMRALGVDCLDPLKLE